MMIGLFVWTFGLENYLEWALELFTLHCLLISIYVEY